MAQYHGSQDISFQPDEFRRIGEAMIDAANRCEGELTLCIESVSEYPKVSIARVEIRRPKLRGMQDPANFELHPYEGR